ncbi:MGH1-like glycoside hydrolase domain-containing protein [Streptomyces telluris]|uniref:Glycoside hydrolase n=2 Tax=Streptomyces telluris TaxID=2720021 RepID=A0A9X2LHI4_9ACTN|nr:trehalase family glycosidase [Streptomyces telluris]MCQ8771131.1 glycoside hydrolase [Streptomyces telluris]
MRPRPCTLFALALLLAVTTTSFQPTAAAPPRRTASLNHACDCAGHGYGYGYGYDDVLDLRGAPTAALPGLEKDNNSINVFADRGAWHAYALPAAGAPGGYGGFTGPLYIAQEYPWWLSTSFSRIRLSQDGRPLDLAGGGPPRFTSRPGSLFQAYDLGGGLRLTLELRYATHRTALVGAVVRNTGRVPRTLGAAWTGSLLRPAEAPMSQAPSLAVASRGVAVDFAKVRAADDFLTDGTERFEVRHRDRVRTTVSEDGDSYRTELAAPFTLAPGTTRSLDWTESYTFTEAERTAEAAEVRRVLADPARTVRAADARWRGYVDGVTAGVPAGRRRLAVKALETLVTNWRSAAGSLAHDGITPSLSYKWFAGGLWAWDTWKQAVGTARFDAGLAEAQIRSVLDHQVRPGSTTRPQDAGMVPDAVFYNDPRRGGTNWNERNSKPPLGAWSVWQVYERSGNRDFLREVYPKLAAYQEWWYRNRDHDHNGLAEYGATVDPANGSPGQQRLAAAWESGMDNAPRFDAASGTSVVPNRDGSGRVIGYSLTQESVDLNTYLAVDQEHLGRIAAELGMRAAAGAWRAKAAATGRAVRERMYDPATGWFHDTALGSGARLTERGRGIEGAIPLWGGVATRAQAAAVRGRLLDPSEFGTEMPLPTVSKSSPYFAARQYWRGPVWLDQAYFAIAGMHRYGFGRDADALATRLIERAAGLTGNGPIMENYDPLSGAALNSPNFSWSAALLLPLIAGRQPGPRF